MAPRITYDQSSEQIRELWDRVGAAHDADLIARVETFQRGWVRLPYRLCWPDMPSRLDERERRCGCGPVPLAGDDES